MKQAIFGGAIVAWLVLWGILEHWQAQRRQKRDRYASLNEGR